MRKYDSFWLSNKDWYHWTENGDRVLNDDAPPEAKASYERYNQQRKEAEESVKSGKTLD